VSMMADR